MPRKQFSFLSLALACLLPLQSCGRQSPIGPGGAEGTLVVRADVSGTAVATVVVSVTAPDIPSPLVFNLPVTDGVAAGAITLPAGSHRTVTIRAFDAGGIETHAGSVTLDVAPGSNGTVSAVLTPLTDHVSITVTLGRYSVTVTPSPDTLAIGRTVQLAAAITDWNGNPTAGTVSWATNDPAVARVDGSGLVTAVGAGTAGIVGTFQGAAGVALVTVTP